MTIFCEIGTPLGCAKYTFLVFCHKFLRNHFKNIILTKKINLKKVLVSYESSKRNKKIIGIDIYWLCCFAPCCDEPSITRNAQKGFPYFFVFRKLGYLSFQKRPILNLYHFMRGSAPICLDYYVKWMESRQVTAL